MTTGYIVMGVCGAGKSTIAKMLADRLGWQFFDADDFHPPANISKLKHGIPLNDDDRRPWLESLGKMLKFEIAAGRHPVLACSALKRRYREMLRTNGDGIKIVYLHGSQEFIMARLQARKGHFMSPSLLTSQIEALEDPSGEPDVITVDISESPEEVIESILEKSSTH